MELQLYNVTFIWHSRIGSLRATLPWRTGYIFKKGASDWESVVRGLHFQDHLLFNSAHLHKKFIKSEFDPNSFTIDSHSLVMHWFCHYCCFSFGFDWALNYGTEWKGQGDTDTVTFCCQDQNSSPAPPCAIYFPVRRSKTTQTADIQHKPAHKNAGDTVRTGPQRPDLTSPSQNAQRHTKKS